MYLLLCFGKVIWNTLSIFSVKSFAFLCRWCSLGHWPLAQTWWSKRVKQNHLTNCSCSYWSLCSSQDVWFWGCFNTPLEHTPSNLYQAAIFRDSFHSWRTGDCLGCAISGSVVPFLDWWTFGSSLDLLFDHGETSSLSSLSGLVSVARALDDLWWRSEGRPIMGI